MSDNRRIDSLQALRAIAFAGIFLLHVGVSVSWAELGVSIFFVLSGFLLTLNNKDRDLPCGMKSSFRFMISKVGKIYPLHIITMVFVLVRTVAQMWTAHVAAIEYGKLARDVALNITLLQSYVPSRNICVSLNGVAWYLSTSLVLYLLFPCLLKALKKLKRKAVLLGLCVVIFLVQIIVSYLTRNVTGPDGTFQNWLTYHSFIFRLGEFIVGMCLGLVFTTRSQGESKISFAYTVYEVLAIGACVGFYYLYNSRPDNAWIKAVLNPTTGFTILAAILIYLFASGRGALTYALTNKPLVWIGNLSGSAFLIHFVAAQYIFSAISFLHIDNTGMVRVITVIIQFIASLLLSLFYEKIKSKLISKSKKG